MPARFGAFGREVDHLAVQSIVAGSDGTRGPRAKFVNDRRFADFGARRRPVYRSPIRALCPIRRIQNLRLLAPTALCFP